MARPDAPADLSAFAARGMGEPGQDLIAAETTCQAIGRAANEGGLQGLIVPSLAAPGETNIVLSRDHVPANALVPRMPGAGWPTAGRPA